MILSVTYPHASLPALVAAAQRGTPGALQAIAQMLMLAMFARGTHFEDLGAAQLERFRQIGVLLAVACVRDPYVLDNLPAWLRKTEGLPS